MLAKAIVVLIFSFFLTANITYAKVLPQSKKALPIKAVTKVSNITVSPRLRADRRALIVYFGNLQNATSVFYSLTYNTSTQQEGAMGALTIKGASNQSQELLFGTCSKNVCTYHRGIKDAKLDISYTLKNGKKYLRKFKIKV